MKIITRGKGIEKWSVVSGIMRIDRDKPYSIKFDFKDENGNTHQILIEFNDYEAKKIKKAFEVDENEAE